MYQALSSRHICEPAGSSRREAPRLKNRTHESYRTVSSSRELAQHMPCNLMARISP